MSSINAVTVYCSSSRTLAPHFYDAATELGHAIAANNWKLVYGGNSLGLMKSVADAVRAAGGKVCGITPQLFVDHGHDDKNCELIVTADMRQRKQLLEHHGDAFIALPGGLGTFEEILEIIVGRQIACHNKPIVLLSIDGYWKPLLAMIENGIQHNFIKPKARSYFFVADTVPQAIEYLRSYKPQADNDPWIKHIPSAVE